MSRYSHFTFLTSLVNATDDQGGRLETLQRVECKIALVPPARPIIINTRRSANPLGTNQNQPSRLILLSDKLRSRGETSRPNGCSCCRFASFPGFAAYLRADPYDLNWSPLHMASIGFVTSFLIPQNLGGHDMNLDAANQQKWSDLLAHAVTQPGLILKA